MAYNYSSYYSSSRSTNPSDYYTTTRYSTTPSTYCSITPSSYYTPCSYHTTTPRYLTTSPSYLTTSPSYLTTSPSYLTTSPTTTNYSSNTTTTTTRYHYNPVTVKSYQDEWARTQSDLKYQQRVVDNMIDSLREERRTRFDSANAKCNLLSTRIDSDRQRIDSLESDLSGWKTRFSNMHDRFSNIRQTLERKDYSMDRMREDLNKCTSTVNDVVAKSQIALNSYNQLASDLKLKQVQWERDEREKRDNLYRLNHYDRFRALGTYRSQYDDATKVKVSVHIY